MSIFGADKVGLLDSLNSEYWIDCPDTSSAIIKVIGNFNGVISVEDSGLPSDQAASTGVLGGRIVFKSGVGSLGENKIRNDGTEILNEYRIVTGGQSIRLKMTEWISGYAFVRVFASHNPSLLFINGPVHSAEEEATRARRAYVASTGAQSISTTQTLYTILKNPANSGINLFLTERIFGTNQKTNDVPIYYQAWGNPTAVLSNNSTPINRFLGGVGSNVSFTYQIATTGSIAMGGTIGSGEPIPLGGIVRERKFQVIVPPNTSLGFAITGTNVASGSMTAFCNLQWYEELIN